MSRAWLEGVGLSDETEPPPPPRAATSPPQLQPQLPNSPTATAGAPSTSDAAAGHSGSSTTRMRLAAISKAAEELLREPAPSKAPSQRAASLLQSLLGPATSGGDWSASGEAPTAPAAAEAE